MNSGKNPHSLIKDDWLGVSFADVEKPATHAKNLGKTPPSSKPAFAKDFDYLIRDELDADQPSSGIQRNGIEPSIDR